MKARIFIQKLIFLCRLLSSRDTIATRTFCTLAAQDVYNISLIQQCIFLDSCLSTSATATMLSNPDLAASVLAEAKKSIYAKDVSLTLKEATSRSSTSLIADINWLRVWEAAAARDKGPFWISTAQNFFKLLTTPLHGDRVCWRCLATIPPPQSSFIDHLLFSHCTSSVDLHGILSALGSDSNSPPVTHFKSYCLVLSLPQCDLIVFLLCMLAL